MRNPEKYKLSAARCNRRYYLAKKAILAEAKSRGCSICGYNRCPWAIEFHHPEKSEMTINYLKTAGSPENLKKEIEKCITVCANCHREIHFDDGVDEPFD